MLSVEGLVSRYGRIEVLHGITFHVQPKEIVALVGSNGAGKTTLLKAISGIQPIDTGKVIFDGQPIEGVPSHKRVKHGMALVPEGRQIFTPLTVEDNLTLGRWSRKGDFSADLKRIYDLFPILRDFRQRLAGSLSGGQQQMLAIGRALMSRPSMLLLDEPSMGLAPNLVEKILDVLKLLRNEGMTILVVEQNVQQILSIADRGYVLEMGEVSLEGTGRALLSDPRVQAAYLGL